MEQIRSEFEKIVPLTDTDWQCFASRLACVEFPKKYGILKAGKTEQYLSFIEKGIVRQYVAQGLDEKTFAIVFDGNFVSGYDSLLTQTPSTYYIETLTPVTLWRLNYEDLQMIYRETAAGERIGRYAAEELFLKKSRRELSLLNESAEQRYLNLFESRPRLLQEIPLKYIASYIGITPQALSMIRRRIS